MILEDNVFMFFNEKKECSSVKIHCSAIMRSNISRPITNYMKEKGQKKSLLKILNMLSKVLYLQNQKKNCTKLNLTDFGITTTK